MGLKLSRQQRRQLLDWADEAGELECCGLLLGHNDEVERVERTANVADSPYNWFEIDPVALVRAEKLARQDGPQILGYFHSHPNGRATPSSNDAMSASPDGRYWLIIANGQITSWRPSGGGEGKPVTFEEHGPV